MQKASESLERRSRPETDYERWLRGQNEHYTPGDHPVYGPNMQGLKDDDSDNDGSSNAVYPSMFTGYWAVCSIVLSALFLILVLKSRKVLRKRNHQRGGISYSGKQWEE
ncbi:hypothetical protein BDV25DRAFT_150500 [Aspergillus avenaceus]|uniref:Uncharacterized protein n=1 Tax=Aspergillus avenaceus TaxID=36643 RepID=A0A5N6U239_ASPAV|nr:hypothetical protein BDV25DRAFT_150500 [Aspergillus avenaceus]